VNDCGSLIADGDCGLKAGESPRIINPKSAISNPQCVNWGGTAGARALVPSRGEARFYFGSRIENSPTVGIMPPQLRHLHIC
jgi:hypothetical protein